MRQFAWYNALLGYIKLPLSRVGLIYNCNIMYSNPSLSVIQTENLVPTKPPLYKSNRYVGSVMN